MQKPSKIKFSEKLSQSSFPFIIMRVFHNLFLFKDERHLDLRCWMALASKLMADIGKGADIFCKPVENLFMFRRGGGGSSGAKYIVL